MIKVLHEFLQNFLKEASRSKSRIKKSGCNGLEMLREKTSVHPEPLAPTGSEKHEINRTQIDVSKLKKTYNLLMKKFVNPSLDLIPQSTLEQIKRLNFKKQQEILKHLAPNMFNHKNTRTSTDSNEIDSRVIKKPVKLQSLGIGWSGQITKKCLVPEQERAKPETEIATTFFEFPEVDQTSRSIKINNTFNTFSRDIQPENKKITNKPQTKLKKLPKYVKIPKHQGNYLKKEKANVSKGSLQNKTETQKRNTLNLNTKELNIKGENEKSKNTETIGCNKEYERSVLGDKKPVFELSLATADNLSSSQSNKNSETQQFKALSQSDNTNPNMEKIIETDAVKHTLKNKENTLVSGIPKEGLENVPFRSKPVKEQDIDTKYENININIGDNKENKSSISTFNENDNLPEAKNYHIETISKNNKRNINNNNVGGINKESGIESLNENINRNTENNDVGDKNNESIYKSFDSVEGAITPDLRKTATTDFFTGQNNQQEPRTKIQEKLDFTKPKNLKSEEKYDILKNSGKVNDSQKKVDNENISTKEETAKKNNTFEALQRNLIESNYNNLPQNLLTGSIKNDTSKSNVKGEKKVNVFFNNLSKVKQSKQRIQHKSLQLNRSKDKLNNDRVMAPMLVENGLTNNCEKSSNTIIDRVKKGDEFATQKNEVYKHNSNNKIKPDLLAKSDTNLKGNEMQTNTTSDNLKKVSNTSVIKITTENVIKENVPVDHNRDHKVSHLNKVQNKDNVINKKRFTVIQCIENKNRKFNKTNTLLPKITLSSTGTVIVNKREIPRYGLKGKKGIKLFHEIESKPDQFENKYMDKNKKICMQKQKLTEPTKASNTTIKSFNGNNYIAKSKLKYKATPKSKKKIFNQPAKNVTKKAKLQTHKQSNDKISKSGGINQQEKNVNKCIKLDKVLKSPRSNKPGTFLVKNNFIYPNYAKQRKLHSKKQGESNSYTLRLYGETVKPKTISDIRLLKSVQVINEKGKSRVKSRIHKSSLPVRTKAIEKYSGQLPNSNTIGLTKKVQTRNLFTTENRAKVIVNYLCKRYASLAANHKMANQHNHKGKPCKEVLNKQISKESNDKIQRICNENVSNRLSNNEMNLEKKKNNNFKVTNPQSKKINYSLEVLYKRTDITKQPSSQNISDFDKDDYTREDPSNIKLINQDEVSKPEKLNTINSGKEYRYPLITKILPENPKRWKSKSDRINYKKLKVSKTFKENNLSQFKRRTKIKHPIQSSHPLENCLVSEFNNLKNNKNGIKKDVLIQNLKTEHKKDTNDNNTHPTPIFQPKFNLKEPENFSKIREKPDSFLNNAAIDREKDLNAKILSELITKNKSSINQISKAFSSNDVLSNINSSTPKNHKINLNPATEKVKNQSSEKKLPDITDKTANRLSLSKSAITNNVLKKISSVNKITSKRKLWHLHDFQGKTKDLKVNPSFNKTKSQLAPQCRGTTNSMKVEDSTALQKMTLPSKFDLPSNILARSITAPKESISNYQQRAKNADIKKEQKFDVHQLLKDKEPKRVFDRNGKINSIDENCGKMKKSNKKTLPKTSMDKNIKATKPLKNIKTNNTQILTNVSIKPGNIINTCSRKETNNEQTLKIEILQNEQEKKLKSQGNATGNSSIDPKLQNKNLFLPKRILDRNTKLLNLKCLTKNLGSKKEQMSSTGKFNNNSDYRDNSVAEENVNGEIDEVAPQKSVHKQRKSIDGIKVSKNFKQANNSGQLKASKTDLSKLVPLVAVKKSKIHIENNNSVHHVSTGAKKNVKKEEKMDEAGPLNKVQQLKRVDSLKQLNNLKQLHSTQLNASKTSEVVVNKSKIAIENELRKITGSNSLLSVNPKTKKERKFIINNNKIEKQMSTVEVPKEVTDHLTKQDTKYKTEVNDNRSENPRNTVEVPKEITDHLRKQNIKCKAVVSDNQKNEKPRNTTEVPKEISNQQRKQNTKFKTVVSDNNNEKPIKSVEVPREITDHLRKQNTKCKTVDINNNEKPMNSVQVPREITDYLRKQNTKCKTVVSDNEKPMNTVEVPKEVTDQPNKMDTKCNENILLKPKSMKDLINTEKSFEAMKDNKKSIDLPLETQFSVGKSETSVGNKQDEYNNFFRRGKTLHLGLIKSLKLIKSAEKLRKKHQVPLSGNHKTISSFKSPPKNVAIAKDINKTPTSPQNRLKSFSLNKKEVDEIKEKIKLSNYNFKELVKSQIMKRRGDKEKTEEICDELRILNQKSYSKEMRGENDDFQVLKNTSNGSFETQKSKSMPTVNPDPEQSLKISNRTFKKCSKISDSKNDTSMPRGITMLSTEQPSFIKSFRPLRKTTMLKIIPQ